VNNIASINDKINSLLSLLKKDKSEKNKAEIEKSINRSKESGSPSIELMGRARR
jgi:hypothetical protein